AAAVVGAQSPTSVRAGDSAIVRPDGAIGGFVGGTCAEASVRLYSLRAMESGDPVLLRILPGASEGQPEASEGAVTVKNPCLSGGALEGFLEPHLLAPAPRGLGPAPPAPAPAAPARRREEAARDGGRGEDGGGVGGGGHGEGEERVVRGGLRSEVPYVALVASGVRGQAVRESLDLTDDERARLHTPAGIEIGAETPEEIALAILAEIISLRPEGEPGIAPRPRSTGAAPPPEVPEQASPEPAPVAISTETAVDPVCGMEVAVSEASVHLERDGDLHYFCSEGCRDAFMAQGVPDGAST